MPTYIDVHILQSVPPSNLNRDDSGSPKQALYGGARRARVSSQAWKRAMRQQLADGQPTAEGSTRTKRISSILIRRLQEANADLSDEDAARLVTSVLKPLGIAKGKKEVDTAYLLFFGRRQLDGIIDSIAPRSTELVQLSDKDLDAEMKELSIEKELMTGHPLDVALFGRMVADLATLNVDAATQVAHAISTHAVETEFDYFTALDDEQQRSDEEGAGAAMIGTVEFNSATLYRYASLGLDQLVENLGAADDAVVDGVVRFVDAFTQSMPTGKQNSFAARTRPDVVMVLVRNDQPVNLVSAFEEPVWSRSGFTKESAKKLLAAYQDSTTRWGNVPVLAAVSASSAIADALGESIQNLNFNELLESVGAAVAGELSAEGS